MPQSAAAPSPFTPIAKYGFLSNCHTGALVAPDGTIDWLCVPRFDSPSVFGALLDRGAGSFRFGPFGINVPSDRIYEPGTNTLVTSWKTPTGWVVVRDALTMGPRRGEDTVTPHTRPPADEDAEHVLVRTVDVHRRAASRSTSCASRPSTTAATPGEWSLTRGSPPCRSDRRRSGDHAPDRHAARHRGRARSGATRPAGRANGLSARSPGATRSTRCRRTSRRPTRSWTPPPRFWRDWLARARIPDHELGPLIQRSALTIKGLTYMPTGATVAALTTSLPETPGGERNWDYRYTWIRDSTFTLQALHYLNLDWEADEFMQFIADLERNDDGGLQIMYGIDGRRDLTESLREELSGYAGAHPVRIGNGAFDQRQNDVFGAALDSVLLHTPAQPAAAAAAVAARAGAGRVRHGGVAPTRPGHLGGARQAAALRLLEADVLGRARPCREARGDPRRPRARRQLGGRPPRRSSPTSSSTGSTSAGCCASTTTPTRSTPRRCWPRSSASCPADDQRLRATVLAIADELTENGFVLRYRTDQTDDGLSGKEGTFVICSFWLVSALAIVGEMQRARDLMERLVKVASPLGLYAEEFDVDTGRHLGNFPQAFSHLASSRRARIIVAERLAEITG